MWVRHLRVGEAPAFAEIGRAVGGLTGQGVGAWRGRVKPPANYELHKPLAAFFDVSIDWLIGDTVEPPRPELWEVWLKERRGAAGSGDSLGRKLTDQQVARASRQAETERRQQKPTTAKKRRGGLGGSR